MCDDGDFCTGGSFQDIFLHIKQFHPTEVAAALDNLALLPDWAYEGQQILEADERHWSRDTQDGVEYLNPPLAFRYFPGCSEDPRNGSRVLHRQARAPRV